MWVGEAQSFRSAHLFLTVLGLHHCTNFPLVAVSKGYSPVRGLFTVMGSLVTERGLQGGGLRSVVPTP